MTVRVGINGFGRIGRTFYRAARQRGGAIDVVAVNDVEQAETLGWFLEHDSVHGRLGRPVEVAGDDLVIGDDRIRVLSCPTPLDLPWSDVGADVVIEASRRFAPAAHAAGHVTAGAARVIVTMPSEGADATFVVGVNDDAFDPDRHRVVSMASCTTNCLAPMVKVLDDAFGVECAAMTTVHAYTSDQSLVDTARSELRDGRAASINIIPSKTGAARAMRLVIPQMDGRMDGTALRVPVPDGSVADLTAILGRPASVDDTNEAFRAAAGGDPLAAVLEYSDRPLVSTDVVGRPASCVFDATLTTVVGPLVKVFGWYDNEWGYANRLVDLTLRVA